MSFRGGRAPAGRGFSRGGGGRDFGRGGGGRGGGGRGRFEEGPPAEICEVGLFVHNVEGELLCRLTNANIPYFNAGIYLENKAKIGKVEEILGPVNRVFFSIKPDHGVNPASFKENDKFYIGTDKLLPKSRFTEETKGKGGGRGGGSGGGRGRGGPGGRSFGRGGGRGGRSSSPSGRGYSGSSSSPGRGFSSPFSRGGGREFGGGSRGRGRG